MITLYEFRSSPYCEKARLVMDIKGLDYKAVEINGLDRSELKGISTHPTVPVITDGDRVVEDSTDISSSDRAILQRAFQQMREAHDGPSQPGGEA